MKYALKDGEKLTTIVSQPKWKSSYFWAAIVAQVLSIIELSGLSKKWGLDLGTIGTVVASLLQLLVLLGIINDSGNAKEW
jgi:uncharacterized membrane protein